MILATYKAGFTEIFNASAMRKGIDQMKPFVGSAQDRYRQFGTITQGTARCDKDNKLLKPLWIAMSNEAHQLARTPADVVVADRIQFWADEAVSGSTGLDSED